MAKLRLLLAANLISTVGTGVTSYLIIWLLVDQLKQSVLYGILTMVTMMFVFIASPFLGSLVDRHSRKHLFLLLEIVGALILVVFLVFYHTSHMVNVILVVLLILYHTTYDAIKYPTLSALTQEMFRKEEYSKVNSSLEVQGQAALMISSGLAAYLIGHISFTIILVINLITFVIAAIFIYKLPYQSNHEIKQQSNATKSASYWVNFISSLHYLFRRKILFILLLTTFVPSIVIIVANYLDPIFIYQYLHEGPSVIGVANILYAIGAIGAGFIAYQMSKKLGDIAGIILFMIVFAIATIAIFLMPHAVTFMVASLFWGNSNAAIRIFRKSYMFHQVDNAYMGRVNSLMNACKLLGQISLIGILTITVVPAGRPHVGYLILFIIVLLSLLVTTYFFMKKVRTVK
ncbi:MFS transporter [Bacillus sp. 179-C3.3 HS]|uniref:MFS transporter n=1 Tax=Bacillus sp. 179-C3.3 HS TaxID=3232162 RepID=UPI0039A179FC